jgi:intracellular multiplication protein IcmO
MIRGIDVKQEQAARNLARDTRPLGVRIAETISKPEVVLLVCLTSCVAQFIYVMASDILFLGCTLLYWFAATRKGQLPFRVPLSANALDYSDPIPGTTKAKKGVGITFFGNDRVTGEELWFTDSDLRTHVLVFGSTGSGKTEFLVSLAYNSLVQSSGFIYIDGKGDNSLFAKIFSMSRTMGREDDILLINFMTGARDVLGPQKTRLSNTMNPFCRGSSSMLSNLVVSLMPGNQPGGGGDDMWKGRAINFVESLLKILVAMRDAGHILLDANSIRNYFMLEKLEQIVIDKKFPVTDTYSVSIENLPPVVMEPITAYLANLPGYNKQKKGNQSSEVREQHGFITMQLTRVFGSLADTYGHIIRTNLPEVDLKDVVLNRRIMVVLLPALEKAPEELSNLGKIIIASLKAMMAAGLGDEVEGDYRDVILRKPTNSPSPFVCIMDEYGYYAVPGFAVVPAQARSLGFSAVFAGQDLPAFQKASKEEAASIGANCNIKMCMKLEDPQETFEFFNKVAGEAFVTSVSGFQMDAGSISLNYMDTRNASVDRRQRIDVLDLKDQAPGQAHIFFKSKIIRADVFYAAPKPVKRMRLNQYLKIEPPSEQKLIEMDKRFKRFKQIFLNPKFELPTMAINSDLEVLANSLIEADDLQPFERGLSGLISILESEVEKQHELNIPYEEAGDLDKMSIFTPIPLSPLVSSQIGTENEELFALPLLRHGSTQEDLKNIERLCGKTESDAEKSAESLSKAIEEATHFPPEELGFMCTSSEMLADVKALIQLFGGSEISVNSLTIEPEEAGNSAPKSPLEVDMLSDLPNDIFDIHLKQNKEDEEDEEEK